MNRNDYRRALIMLRGLTNGLSGHARLERRTMMATLQFTVNGDAGGVALFAVLIGCNSGRCYAANLGALTQDRLRLSGGLFQFDPRNIERRMLEDYTIIGISSEQGELLMSGNLQGSFEVDWMAVNRCLAELFNAQPDLASQAPAPEPLQTAGFYISNASESSDEPMAIDQLSGIEWPDSALSVRPLFEQQLAFIPFDAPDIVFVRAPVGDADGIVGLRVEGDRLVSLCCGVPGEYAPEVPANLAGYAWRDGYWIICIDLFTGEPVD